MFEDEHVEDVSRDFRFHYMLLSLSHNVFKRFLIWHTIYT